MAFEAHYSRVHLLRMVPIGLIFAAGGLWFLLDADLAADPGRRLAGLSALTGLAPATLLAIIGSLAVALGLAGTGHYLRLLFHTGPAMRIDGEGIYWHRWSATPIPWHNVAGLQDYSVSGQKMVRVSLVDRSRNPGGGLLGTLAGLNAATGFGDLSLTMQGTDRGHDELVAALAQFAPAPA